MDGEGINENDRKIVVFVGPSIEKRDIKEIMGDHIQVHPPIRRGDLEKFDKGYIVLIIDGVFGSVLAISPQEIQDFILRGNIVYGASSMGALRASELWSCGMIGYGKIFEAYKLKKVVSDAEVALIFSENDYCPLSEPLIHLRFFLQEMHSLKFLTKEESETVFRQMENIYFPELSFERLFEELKDKIDHDKLIEIKSFFYKHKEAFNIKRQDAVGLLHYIYEKYMLGKK